MTSQTWYEPPDRVAPIVGDVIRTMIGKLTVIDILEVRDGRYLLRLEGADPEPCA
jgi:regulator of protease activity HflC (stomatin/prohibitin superfamily)